ncbi:hypothetical protein B0H17DRAFT_496085 [Mycena rosella]|uniref:Uncharacterized protein n=1 Tax=Mycena rosella TaxID=1033263 RepID=A0AAD7C302_MYCRO|nr:hypothetical protein B0H17DRAFT_496085 [Mycena rosella]
MQHSEQYEYEYEPYDTPSPDARRNRFLPSPAPDPNHPSSSSGNGGGHGNGSSGNGNGNGNGGGQRAASQPPHSASAFLASPPPSHRVPVGISSTTPTRDQGAHGSPWGLGLRSSSFSSARFASTFEDDELVDPDDDVYDARYNHNSSAAANNNNNNNNGGYRGRTYAADLSRSRSQSLATQPVGSGRTASSSPYNNTSSAAFSIPGTQRYGELPGSRYGSLGALGVGAAAAGSGSGAPRRTAGARSHRMRAT